MPTYSRLRPLPPIDSAIDAGGIADERLVYMRETGLLAAIHDPPATLWAKGCADSLRAPAVGLVGSRAASPYGLEVARRLGGDLARRGHHLRELHAASADRDPDDGSSALMVSFVCEGNHQRRRAELDQRSL